MGHLAVLMLRFNQQSRFSNLPTSQNFLLGCVCVTEFVNLQLRVMSGEVTHVTSVPGGTVLWALSWEGMLTAELAWFQQVGLKYACLRCCLHGTWIRWCLPELHDFIVHKGNVTNIYLPVDRKLSEAGGTDLFL
jgi:hypothetical protein